MKILIIDTAHPVLQQKLEKSGFECDYFPELNSAQIEEIIHKYDGVIGRSKVPFNKNLVDKAINLKFIGRVGAGMENIDIEYAGQKGIKCFNSPEGNRDAVGEHTLALLLNLLNKINIADSEIRSGQWNRESNRGVEIKGKIIGIIGYGNMGSAFAQRLQGFDATVIAYDKYKKNYSDNFVVENSLEELFEKSDIISLHITLTDENHYLADNLFFNNFRKNIYFINTSRGKVVKTDDLVLNIKTGKIIGAALDVLEYESESFENLYTDKIPESLHYLLQSNRIVLSPHIAGWTIESNYKLADFLADKIIHFYKKSGS